MAQIPSLNIGKGQLVNKQKQKATIMYVPFFIYRAHSLIDRHSSRVYLCIIANGLIRVVVSVLVLLLFRVKQ